jgi:hypothetical protein
VRFRFRISPPPVDFANSAMKVGSYLLLLASAVALSAGCHEPTGPKVIASHDLDVKIPAIKRAVQNKDRTELAELVKELDDDDAAVRLYAIEGLQRLTGQDLDYRYYDDKEARKPAVERWKKWLSEQKN